MHPALAHWLRLNRPALNARFANAQRRFATLDGQVFLDYVKNDIDVLVRALHNARDDRIAELCESLFELGLRLVGQGVLGRCARYPMILPLWHEIALRAPRLVAQSPRRLFAALANACIHVADQGRYPEFYQRLLASSAMADLDRFLRAGQVAAWRSGLAHYRASALSAAAHLDAAALGFALDVPAERAHAELDALKANRWHGCPGTGPRLVARAGQFRGLGGPFVAPPLVATVGKELLARAGDQVFVLHADAFGSSFHAVAGELWPGQSAVPPGAKLLDQGVRFGTTEVSIPGAGPMTSVAVADETFALTCQGSHVIALGSLH